MNKYIELTSYIDEEQKIQINIERIEAIKYCNDSTIFYLGQNAFFVQEDKETINKLIEEVSK